MSNILNESIWLIKSHYDWATCKRLVASMQSRIAKAYLEGNMEDVTRLQAELVQSLPARVVAVIKVITNTGSQTAGVDGVVWREVLCLSTLIRC